MRRFAAPMARRIGAVAVAWILVVSVAGCRAGCGEAEFIEIESRPLALLPQEPEVRRVGALTHRGGLVLSSPDSRFGGLSALLVSPERDGFLALSDRGYWIEGKLAFEAGALVGVEGGGIRCILDERGRPVRGDAADAEGLARIPDASDAVFVSFERRDRIARYALTAEPRLAQPVPAFPGLEAVEFNRGIEALVHLADGSLLAITEATRDAAGHVVGWLRQASGDAALALRLDEAWGLTAMARLPDGDVLTLERWFLPPDDLRIRLRRIAVTAIRAGAVLDGEVLAEFGRAHAMDNMEGLDVVVDDAGTPLVFMVSDDNYSSRQRTLLHVFALSD